MAGKRGKQLRVARCSLHVCGRLSCSTSCTVGFWSLSLLHTSWERMSATVKLKRNCRHGMWLRVDTGLRRKSTTRDCFRKYVLHGVMAGEKRHRQTTRRRTFGFCPYPQVYCKKKSPSDGQSQAREWLKVKQQEKEGRSLTWWKTTVHPRGYAFPLSTRTWEGSKLTVFLIE